MHGVYLVPVPHQPCFVSNITPGTNWGSKCDHLKLLAESNGSQNVFLGDSLVSNFMKFGNQEWRKLHLFIFKWANQFWHRWRPN